MACVRRKADVTARQAIEDARDAQASRFLSWWYFDEGKRLGLKAELPAAEGAAVARALEYLADGLPVMPGEEDAYHAAARRADALVTLASTSLAKDSGADRTAVVIHAPLETLVFGDKGCEVEGGGLIHAETARRLICSGRVQALIENGHGNPVGVGRMAAEPRRGWCASSGLTMHHKLVHEYGWTVTRAKDGTVEWFHPDGVRHRGPAPPAETFEDRPAPQPWVESRVRSAPERAGVLS